MRRVHGSVLAILAMLAASGCQRGEDEEALVVEGRLFTFNYRVATATYVLTLGRNRPLPDDARLIATYENPAGGTPLTTRTRIYPFWDKIALESPPVHCVVKNRPYAVKIEIVDASGSPLQTIETSVTSSLDQTVLPAKPLVVGAIYTANPEVYRPGETPDFSPEGGCPKP